MLRKIDNFEAQDLAEDGYNVYHVFAPEGFCYVLSKDVPVVNGSYIVVKIPKRFVKNPHLYAVKDYYKGWFWYVSA